jgi:hypothetical protein
MSDVNISNNKKQEENQIELETKNPTQENSVQQLSETSETKKPSKNKKSLILTLPVLGTTLVLILLAVFAAFYLPQKNKDNTTDKPDPKNINISATEFKKLEEPEQVQNLKLDLEDSTQSLNQELDFDASFLEEQTPSANQETTDKQ